MSSANNTYRFAWISTDVHYCSSRAICECRSCHSFNTEIYAVQLLLGYFLIWHNKQLSLCLKKFNSSPPDGIFISNFMNENVRIPIQISLKFVHGSLIYDMTTLAQVMAWHGTGRRQASSAPKHYLSQWWPSLLTHICGSRGRWINTITKTMTTDFMGLKPEPGHSPNILLMFHPLQIWTERAILMSHNIELSKYKNVCADFEDDNKDIFGLNGNIYGTCGGA